jgi:putative restriction endonuclease
MISEITANTAESLAIVIPACHEADMNREAFSLYMHETTRDDTGTIKSYMKALELLGKMIHQSPEGFGDCENIWQISTDARLRALEEKIRHEQKKEEASVWYLKGQKSYLQKGFCAAAIAHYRRFLLERKHQDKLINLFRTHQGDPDELAKLLNQEVKLPKDIQKELKGKEAIRQVKVRTNQGAFRDMILETYHNRCCVTGLDIPQLCIASHIIPWSDRKDTRMDVRNGLCLSATYDKAFDKHLISFDEKYCLIVSRNIRDHYRNDHARELFEKREGQKIDLPLKTSYKPMQAYLETHRSKVVV